MKVLLIGGTGCISGEVAARAAARPDIELFVLNRGSRPQFVPPGATTLTADINDADAVRRRLAGHRFDAVADFIAYGTDQVKRDLDLLAGHFRQYIFVSSATVYRPARTGEVVYEDRTPTGNLGWGYARDKWLAEHYLAQRRAADGLDYTVVRPWFTYNNLRLFTAVCSDEHQRVSWTLADRILKGKPLLMFDDGEALCSMIYAADFAKGFVGLFGRPEAYGQAYHITCDEHFTFNRAAEMLGEALGRETWLCHVPAQILGQEFGPYYGEKFVSYARAGIFDSSKIRRLVPEFKCETYFADGLKKCLAFYRAHPEYQVVDPQWDASMDRLAAAYGGGRVR